MRCGCAVALAIVMLSPSRVARAVDTEAIALELLFEGVAPCFTSAELADAVAQRSGQAIATAATDPPLSIRVRVRPATGSGFDVTIESRERDGIEPGLRELQVAGDCDGLASPLSLVLALMVGDAQPGPPQAGSEPVAAPALQASATPVGPAADPAPSAPPANPPAPGPPAPTTPRPSTPAPSAPA